MRGNIFYREGKKTLYGTQYGWAIEYEVVNEDTKTIIRFKPKMILPDDIMNCPRPLKIKLVAECIYKIAKKSTKDVVVILYGREVKINQYEDNAYDIMYKIRNLQTSFISIDENVPTDIWLQIKNGMKVLLDDIDVY